MKVAGITAEYNPFHNGHAYLIDKARQAGADCVVAVMSGDFVQRGEPALFASDIRTRCALAGGADLVLRLPVTHAISGAKNFALGAVNILDSLGKVDFLVFGSESANGQAICKAAELIESPEVQNAISQEMKKGIAFASARENAVRKFDEECAGILGNPNDILAVEYASALNKLQSGIIPKAIKRTGVMHDSSSANSTFASASYIRECVINGKDFKNYVPSEVFDILISAPNERKITDFKRFETAVLYRLRSACAEEIAHSPDVSEGIENRIFAASKEAKTLDELYSKVKTKRYSHARIRRIILNFCLGITDEDSKISVPYIGVCGFNERGASLLKSAYETASLPIITKASDIKNAGKDAQRLFEIECRAGDLYSLFADETGECGGVLKQRPIVL